MGRARGGRPRASTCRSTRRWRRSRRARTTAPSSTSRASVRGRDGRGEANVEETGATFVHPFEDPLLSPARERSVSSSPNRWRDAARRSSSRLAGGWLHSGIAYRPPRDVRPDLRIVGVQGRLFSGFTIADGVLVKKPGDLTMSILDDVLDDMVHIEDEAIRRRSSSCSSGRSSSSRAPVPSRSRLSSLLRPAARARGRVLSGGNIDPSLLISVMRHGLTVAGGTSSSAPGCPTGPASWSAPALCARSE